ncbi:WD40 repeat [Trypanosoma melophagium]|uniref:WD40 repeat n=1 Tax=Trypanosoma melophagium TaxID=715481 RepID=UPI00351A305D|nr:WD40 repeat [Trypanosoma melophagium]
MFCCISNRVPHEPVVSRTSGCLYERSLIEKYITEHGRCPVTGEPLQREDLITVRPTTLTGSPPSGETIPALLTKLHSQWDAIMLEQFSLRQQLAQTQQELAHALHQYEAACRVIATFIKDRGMAETQSGEPTEGRTARDSGNPALPDAALKDLGEYDTVQRAKRKTRLPPPTLASKQNVQDFVEDGSVDVGKTAWAVTRVTEKSVVIGLDDASVVHYDLAEGRMRGTGLGHERAVRHTVSCCSGGVVRLVSASDDATLRLWSCESEMLVCQGVLRQHKGGIVGLGNVIADHLLLSASATGVGLADINSMESLAFATTTTEDLSALTCLGVHPYGSLAALGTKSSGFCIWNTQQMCVDTTVSLTDDGDVCSLAFNADCFTLATALFGGKTLLWDLRKMSVPLHGIPPSRTAETASASMPGDVPVVAFDGYGKYLAIGGQDIRVFDWTTSPEQALSTLNSHLQPVTGLCWGEDARSLVSCSMDRTVKLYGSA